MADNNKVEDAIEKETAKVEAVAPKVEEAKTSSETPAPGTPEFAAWAWEHRNG